MWCLHNMLLSRIKNSYFNWRWLNVSSLVLVPGKGYGFPFASLEGPIREINTAWGLIIFYIQTMLTRLCYYGDMFYLSSALLLDSKGKSCWNTHTQKAKVSCMTSRKKNKNKKNQQPTKLGVDILSICSDFIREMCHFRIIAFVRLTRIQSTWQ